MQEAHPVGTRVIVRDLIRRPELNGRSASIVDEACAAGRVAVKVDGAAAAIALKPENFSIALKRPHDVCA